MERVLKLDKTGRPDSWITPGRAVYYYFNDKVKWSHGDLIRVWGGHNLETGEKSYFDVNSIIAVRNRVVKQGTPALDNRALFARDRQICGYCGNHFVQADLTRDHIHPLSKGGINHWSNVVTSCKSCNNRKGDHLLENINMELLYVPYVPDYAESLILRNRSIKADQMDYLMGFVKNKNSRLL